MVTEKEPELIDELEAAKGQAEELKQQKETLTRQLESRDAVITRLEKALAAKDSELATLKQSFTEAEKKSVELEKALAQAVSSYRAMIVESNPRVLAELITGDTIDEVNESLKNARALIDKVKQEMEAEVSRTKVPAGAPQRAPLDLSVLSPRDKIQYAIGGNR